jgi:hypothetical protein
VEDFRNMQIWMSVLIRNQSLNAQKIHEQTICRIPDSRNIHEMSDEEGKLP